MQGNLKQMYLLNEIKVSIMRRMNMKCKLWLFRKRNNILLLIFLSGIAIFTYQGDLFPLKVTPEKRSEPVIHPSITSLFYIDKSITHGNDTYTHRKQKAERVCQLKRNIIWPPVQNKLPRFKDSPLISKKYNLTFCPVGKVASSFFTRFMMVIESNGTLASPYDVPIEKASRDRVASLKSLNKSVSMLAFLHSSTKLVFGRDPYSRILSAYIDKMLSPNPFYWRQWGEKSLKLDKVKKSSRCASDISFSQFVRLVQFDLHKKDVHLMPVHVVCNMCGVNYDVIGKLETLRLDLDYLAQLLNVSSAFQYTEGYKLVASMDAVYDSVKSAFSWKSDIQKCVGLDQMGLRIWRKLQLRGIIDSRLLYPFKRGDMENMTASGFISACQSAIRNSTDQAQLKKQKNQVFLEAYSSITSLQRQTLSTIYRDDFDAFGYDPMPARIFANLESVKTTDYLDFNKPWII